MDWGMMQNPNAVLEHAVGQCIPTSISYFPASTNPDVKLDVKHQTRNCLDTALRPRLRFGTTITLAVVLLDTFLRFSWTLRFCWSAIFPTNDAYILTTEFLEVFRRAVWNLLRVEWEHIKQTKKAKKDAVVVSALESEFIESPKSSSSSSRERIPRSNFD